MKNRRIKNVTIYNSVFKFDNEKKNNKIPISLFNILFSSIIVMFIKIRYYLYL